VQATSSAAVLPAVLREMWERLALDQRHEREDRRHGLAAPHTQDHRAARFFAGAGLAGTLKREPPNDDAQLGLSRWQGKGWEGRHRHGR